MDKIFKVAIIGGGAAGLFSAVELCRGEDSIKGEDVVIIERNDRLGKKLLATGNGQCNITNTYISEANYYGESKFVSAFLKNLASVDLPDYLQNIGIPLTSLKDGRAYPMSRQASAFLDVLRRHIERAGINVITGVKVEKISFDKEKGLFLIGEKTAAKMVIICVGGKAAKQFGTDGTSYNLATAFNHSITPLYPSIVQIKTEKDKIKGLKGIKERGVITLTDGKGGKPLKSAEGDILFTDYGVSGDAAFKVSGALKETENPYLKISFLPELSAEETEKLIKKQLICCPLDIGDVFSCVLNKNVGKAIMKTVNVKDAESLANAVKNFGLKVEGTLGFDYAQATKGGIKTSDIDENTYRSKLQKGLYITGETLNIDGDCGGYNLTFAAVSAITAARDVKRDISGK